MEVLPGFLEIPARCELGHSLTGINDRHWSEWTALKSVLSDRMASQCGPFATLSGGWPRLAILGSSTQAACAWVG